MNSFPPPTSRVIRSRIPSDYEILAKYHQHHLWIPGRDQIRPTPEMKAVKEQTLRDIEQTYRSTTDYILSTVFQFPTVVDRRGKLAVAGVTRDDAEGVWSEDTLHRLFVQNPSIKPFRFVPNSFPYQLDAGGNHFVMWYSTSRLLKGDDEISHGITRGIKQLLKESGAGGMDFDFAWYVNPKMTVPELAHVQVFWAVLDDDKSVRQDLPAAATGSTQEEGGETMDEAEAAMLAEAIRLSLEGAQAAKGPGWLPI